MARSNLERSELELDTTHRDVSSEKSGTDNLVDCLLVYPILGDKSTEFWENWRDGLGAD